MFTLPVVENVKKKYAKAKIINKGNYSPLPEKLPVSEEE